MAESLAFAGDRRRSLALLRAADDWEADRTVVDAVRNSDPFVRSWLGRVRCVFCEASGSTPVEVIHADYCARTLAELAVSASDG